MANWYNVQDEALVFSHFQAASDKSCVFQGEILAEDKLWNKSLPIKVMLSNQTMMLCLYSSS